MQLWMILGSVCLRDRKNIEGELEPGGCIFEIGGLGSRNSNSSLRGGFSTRR